MRVRRRARAKLRRIPARIRRLPVSVGYFRGPALMSSVRKAWVLFRNPHATIKFGRATYLGPGFSLHMPYGGTFITGERVQFRRNFRAELGDSESRIAIGSGSICTYDVLIQCGTTIEIGERCIFAQSVLLVDGSHRFRDLERPMLDQGYDFRPLRIEDDAAVMAKCTVIADIGRRAFVGAGAVVTRPVPAYTVSAGVPAQPIDYFGPASSVPAVASDANSDRSG
jgi:acetyltransferase-like isoleucine patch superfamily enzyme